MKKSRPFRWYHRLFYRWSSPYRHDVDRGNRWYIAIGYTQGYNDCLNHAPWPYETHTDPLQEAAPPVKPTIPTGSVRAVYLQADGGPHTKAMEAVNAVKLAEQQATGKMQRNAIKQRIQEEQMRQKEGQS